MKRTILTIAALLVAAPAIAEAPRTVRCDFKSIGPVIIKTQVGEFTQVTLEGRTIEYSDDGTNLWASDADDSWGFTRTSKGLKLLNLKRNGETGICYVVSK